MRKKKRIHCFQCETLTHRVNEGLTGKQGAGKKRPQEGRRYSRTPVGSEPLFNIESYKATSRIRSRRANVREIEDETAVQRSLPGLHRTASHAKQH